MAGQVHVNSLFGLEFDVWRQDAALLEDRGPTSQDIRGSVSGKSMMPCFDHSIPHKVEPGRNELGIFAFGPLVVVLSNPARTDEPRDLVGPDGARVAFGEQSIGHIFNTRRPRRECARIQLEYFYRTATHSAITHVCEIDPVRTRSNPGDELRKTVELAAIRADYNPKAVPRSLFYLPQRMARRVVWHRQKRALPAEDGDKRVAGDAEGVESMMCE
ncbi:hypothetical protein GGTG_09866 [Gaeumannomyces tritici R3-111a-1]|uniref:Uncharacterized protein n=1 Tax=Gaeumannomyces tritici (strain R3-111a-1) TaxID=644352 RepID=J3P8N1_GAET3|nr:hypothetical protein GGTG_09866 [Gaeumannomyces tritici R3-111a-1]EJT73015.1 hypothetical protein GGTG_09866 [Gaeumannomyces tritici R3-111a-1]